MIFRKCLLLSCLIFIIAGFGKPAGAVKQLFFNEQFETLENWEPFYFSKIEQHSRYSIIKENGRSLLQTASSASASAIIYQKSFNIYQFQRMKWRWKVDNIYRDGNAEKKSGDDYPIRIYVMFQYDPLKAGFMEKFKYNTARLLYGKYPPHSSLNYIWANKKHSQKVVKNRYTDRARMIMLEMGSENLKKWREYDVDIISDYRQAFGEDPPAIARIAIMNDSDDTGEAAASQVDYIQVFGEKYYDSLPAMGKEE